MNDAIVIYGMTGTGKSTLGKELAQKEKYDFIDTDSTIENILGKSIKDYIDGHKKKGEWEEKFRTIETETIENSLKKTGKKIISLWWWAIISPQNREIIYKLADKIIHIQSDIKDIVKRIMQDEKNWIHRPSFKYPWKSITPEEIIERWEARKEIYKNSCDFTIHNNGNISESIQELSEKINIWNICIPITNFDPDSLKNTFEEIKKEPSIKFVEFRIDFLKNTRKINEIIQQCPKKVIITNRHTSESGNFTWSFEKSIEILSQINNADYIDIEIKSGDNIQNLKKELEKKKTRLITSYHNFKKTETLDELKNKLKEMKKHNPEVYKIAMMPKIEKDVEIIYKLTDYFKKNYQWKDLVFISMWRLWEQTRAEIPKAGWMVTFATFNKEWSAPGQIHYKKLQNKLYS